MSAEAGIVVISNRTSAKVEFSIVRADGESRRYSLPPGDMVPVPVKAQAVAAFDVEGTARRHLLDVNSVYYFLARKRKLELAKVGFSPPADDTPTPPADGVRLDSVGTIPVIAALTISLSATLTAAPRRAPCPSHERDCRPRWPGRARRG